MNEVDISLAILTPHTSALVTSYLALAIFISHPQIFWLFVVPGGCFRVSTANDEEPDLLAVHPHPSSLSASLVGWLRLMEIRHSGRKHLSHLQFLRDLLWGAHQFHPGPFFTSVIVSDNAACSLDRTIIATSDRWFMRQDNLTLIGIDAMS